MAADYEIAGAIFRALEISGKLYQVVAAPEALPHAVDFAASGEAQAIWTPGSGLKFVIVGYHLSFSAAGVITVWETSTNNLAGRVFQHNGAANGGAAVSFSFCSRTADNVLKYTTGAGAAGSLTVFGYEV